MSDDPQVVSYPLNDVLGRIEGSIKDLGRDVNSRFDRMETQLGQKADKADVAQLSGRVGVLETDKAARDAENRTGRRFLESKRGAWALAISSLAAVAAVGGAVVEAVHH